MDKILINAGSSGPFGWSAISRFMRCPTLYFWHEKLGGEGGGGEAPLVRGSIGHVGLAHLYMRQKCAQEGRSFEDYYRPIQAMHLAAETFGELGQEMLPIAERVVQGYAERYAHESFRIVSVERLVKTEFNGWPYTARLDLEYEDKAGKVWICDHKIVSKIEGKVYRRYVMSGQILAFHHIGAREYGSRFGGVQINLLGVTPPKYERIVPEPAPWILERFPAVVARAHEAINSLRERRKSDPAFVMPATPSEHTCFPYNRPCPYFEACRWGETLPISIAWDEERE